MSVSPKHIATFLLGAAAALGAQKYMSMTPEEKEKLVSDLKDKAHKMKDEAEGAMEKGKEYFEELRTKGADALKDHFPNVENIFHNLFGGSSSSASGKSTTPGADTPNTESSSS